MVQITAPNGLYKALLHEWKYFWLEHSPGYLLWTVYSAYFKHLQGRGHKIYTKKKNDSCDVEFWFDLAKWNRLINMISRFLKFKNWNYLSFQPIRKGNHRTFWHVELVFSDNCWHFLCPIERNHIRGVNNKETGGLFMLSRVTDSLSTFWAFQEFPDIPIQKVALSPTVQAWKFNI